MMPIASYAGLTSGRANDRPVGGKSSNKLGHQRCCFVTFCWDDIYDFDGIYIFLKG